MDIIQSLFSMELFGEGFCIIFFYGKAPNTFIGINFGPGVYLAIDNTDFPYSKGICKKN